VSRRSQVLAHEERYDDLLAEAEGDQLARQVLAGPDGRAPLRDQLLAWVGDHLGRWGCHLWARQSTPMHLCTIMRVDGLQESVEQSCQC